MFMRLPFRNGVLDLTHCRRPEWTLARAATFTSDLDVGLSVPICRREMEIGDRLRWSNVDFGLNLINFTETKTNRDRAVPMEPIVREALLELSQQSSNAEYVFTNPDTATRYTDVKKSFSAACREAGITNFTFHDLRHTFGTRLADAGVDVVKIKELMGHASIVTTMRYIHATDQGKRGAIVVLSEYRQRQRHKIVSTEKRQTLESAVNRC